MSERMSSNMTTAIPQTQRDRFETVMDQWQDAADADFHSKGYTHQSDHCHGTYGKKYAALNIGGSAAFMVDIFEGTIYGIKAWMKVDKNKIVGNIYDTDFDAKVLVRDRFRWGHFTNAPDGSLRQSIVLR